MDDQYWGGSFWGGSFWGGLYWGQLVLVPFDYAEVWDGRVVLNLEVVGRVAMNRVVAGQVVLNKEITDTYSELEAI